jgi:DNA-binding GntR family transcriptional regulator
MHHFFISKSDHLMPPTLSPATTTADSIYHAMRDQIIAAKLMPGHRLVHRQLAKEFGASNSPVLEALRRLESEGLVTSYPNAGAQVKVWQEDDIIETFLAREALEGVTCRLFVQKASPREKARLEEFGKRYDEACRTGQYEVAFQVDIALHLYIAGEYSPSAQSSSLFRLVKNSCLLTMTIRNISLAEDDGPFEAGPIGVHDELIAALNSGDPDLAERVGKAHVRASLEDILRLQER